MKRNRKEKNCYELKNYGIDNKDVGFVAKNILFAKNGFTSFDDYGHYPTEIKSTSDAIKNKTYNKSWVVFQPHTYSSTKNLLDDCKFTIRF